MKEGFTYRALYDTFDLSLSCESRGKEQPQIERVQYQHAKKDRSSTMAKICDVQPVNMKIKQECKSLPHKTWGYLNSEEGEIASG